MTVSWNKFPVVLFQPFMSVDNNASYLGLSFRERRYQA